jgi:hypothetical protein
LEGPFDFCHGRKHGQKVTVSEHSLVNIVGVDIVDEDLGAVIDFAKTTPVDSIVETFLDRVVLWIPEARTIGLEIRVSPRLTLSNNIIDKILFLLHEIILDLTDN